MKRNHNYLKSAYIGSLILLFCISSMLYIALVHGNESPIKFVWTINDQYTDYEMCSGHAITIGNNKLYIGLFSEIIMGYSSNYRFQGEAFDLNRNSLNESAYGSFFDENPVELGIDNEGHYYSLTYIPIIGPGPGEYSGTYTVQKFSNNSILWSTMVHYQGILHPKGLNFDTENNVYVIGYNITQPPYYPKLYYSKFNSTGSLQYEKLYDESGTTFRWGTDVTTDSENNLILIGRVGYPSWSDSMPIIIKCDTSGNQLWNATFVSDPINKFTSRCSIVDSNDNIYVAGHFYKSPDQSHDIFLLKCDAQGNIIWSRTWTKNGDEDCKGITLDSSNNIVLVGETSTESDETKMYLMKCDQSGSLKWSHEWGINGTLNDVALDSLDNIYVIGEGAYSNIPYIAKIIEINNPDYTLLFVLLTIGTITLIGVVVVIIWKKKVRSK